MWVRANLPSVIGEMICALSNTSSYTYEVAPVSTLMEKFILQTMQQAGNISFFSGISAGKTVQGAYDPE